LTAKQRRWLAVDTDKPEKEFKFKSLLSALHALSRVLSWSKLKVTIAGQLHVAAESSTLFQFGPLIFEG
jgi:hypothetical protein